MGKKERFEEMKKIQKARRLKYYYDWSKKITRNVL
jgi:hypothetical protein